MSALSHSRRDLAAWLAQEPPLAELREAFPAEWETVQRELAEAGNEGQEAVLAYVARLARKAAMGAVGPGGQRSRGPLGPEVRRQMAVRLVKELALSAATGVTHGRVRFNLVNGWVAQRLLFRRGFERKPVLLPLFRLVWPLLWQRRLLMPLVQQKGIYCFFSRPLVRELAALAAGRPCLEIAAGDGTLSRFLSEAGATIVATDDGSWAGPGSATPGVERQDARAALRARVPQVVLCSWPPPGNDFEREVFRTPSVELYVVVNSGTAYGSGDPAAYATACEAGWEGGPDERLSRLVLPPELGCVVSVFRRRGA